MLAAATSFFTRTAISQSYSIDAPPTPSRTSSPSPATPSPLTFTPPCMVGLWKVQSAAHKTTGKRVSVWGFDKRGGMDGSGVVVEVLKAEASALGRLRHPSILEMVEPLEETRSELIFATEPILSALDSAIPSAPRYSSLVELDEVEIQKGILQICKGLSFLHSSAKLIHSNISPESIIVNSAGDWKISGLGLTIPLVNPDGSPTRWEFPTFDARVPSYIQRSFDYMAPEYALDEILATASDMYSLGCLIYAVHCKGSPPFKTHGSLGGLREVAGRTPPGMERLDGDLQAMLRSLLTRTASPRPTPLTLPSHPFFSSLPISTLNFLDRQTFTSKSREEKVSFMKGLVGVLGSFSEGLRTRKILPMLVEEMKDTHLLPYILPNVFSISSALSSTQFANMVLPSLKPLFVVKEPPQNMLTLLDNLGLLMEKTDKAVFREQVLPLVYNALESEHTVVQERALSVVPDLCETIDYAEVQGVLFPNVAFVFTQTRILSVKVATLTTFLTMVKTLDQTTLTQKMVPLLSKIRTKEPAVMMATLSVQEAMGFKVDREAVANLVLPQLWTMSMGPLLNLDQFNRFMSVIRKLGDRVEKEHAQFLRDSQRLSSSTTTTTTTATSGTVDFESLVAGTGVGGAKVEDAGWEDDVWGSIFTQSSGPQSPPLLPTPTSLQAKSLPSTPKLPSADLHPHPRPVPRPSGPTVLLARPTHAPTTSQSKSSFTLQQPLQPTNTGGSRFAPPAQMSRPNYNISLATASPTAFSPPPSRLLTTSSNYATPPLTSPAAPPTFAPPPAMGSLLAPSKPPQPTWGSTEPKKLTKDDWGDFDPLA